MKGELDLKDKVGEFKKGESEVESVVDEMSIELGTGVWEDVKVGRGNGYFEGV